jgi:hypothetical protein
MQNTTPLFSRTTGVLVCAVLALSSLHAADAAKPTSDQDALSSFDDYVTLSGQANWVKGDKAAFQAENWTSKQGFGGIEDFQLTKDLKNDYSLKADGHLLLGSEDYLAHINLSKNELGSVDVGYKRFRTYYDGIGGFFPNDEAWFPLPNEELHVDRAKFWTEVKLTLPNAPVLTLRYTNDLRNGAKDSTIWGDNDNTGIPKWTVAPTNPIASDSKITPSILQLDERRQTLEGSLKHTMGNTTFEGQIVGERIDNLDTRSISRYPGESTPPGFTSTSANPSPVSKASNAASGYDQQGVKTDSLTFSGRVETVVSEKITMFAGVSYQHSTSDLAGYRPLSIDIATGTTANYTVKTVLGGVAYNTFPIPAVVSTSSARPAGAYQDFTGGSHSEILTANLGADVKLLPDLFINAALKAEDRYTQSNDSFTYIRNLVRQSTGVVTNSSLAYANSSKVKERAWTPELSARYTGIKTISLYATADYRYSPGTESSNYQTDSLLLTTENTKENHGNYAVGANWVPCNFFTLRGETFYKSHQNSFYGAYSTAPSDQTQYVLGSNYYGAKLTATFKPLATLSLTTRYILRVGQMDLVTVGNPVIGAVPATAVLTRYALYDTMDARSHDIGETVDWTPIKQFYVQGNVNIVFDTTSTAYPRAGGAANDVLRNADNNHWNASVIAGFVVDKVTNAEMQYTYYTASNFQPELTATQPYGASAKNYSATVGIKRKLTDKLIAEVKVGYISSKNDTTGGMTNYNAKVAYVSLQQAF